MDHPGPANDRALPRMATGPASRLRVRLRRRQGRVDRRYQIARRVGRSSSTPRSACSWSVRAAARGVRVPPAPRGWRTTSIPRTSHRHVGTLDRHGDGRISARWRFPRSSSSRPDGSGGRMPTAATEGHRSRGQPRRRAAIRRSARKMSLRYSGACRSHSCLENGSESRSEHGIDRDQSVATFGIVDEDDRLQAQLGALPTGHVHVAPRAAGHRRAGGDAPGVPDRGPNCLCTDGTP